MKKTYRLTFRTIDNVKIEREVKATNDAQAFRISESMAKRNNWKVSGKPVKL